MGKRKSISKKIRFDVFKRDAFTCQYCGNHPPSIVLEIDHIEPVSKGGSNDIDNLLTSCFDCNRGKASDNLNSIPQTLIEKTEVIKERELQLKELKKYKSLVKRRITRTVNKIEKVLQEYYPDNYFSDKTKISIRNNFIPNLDIDDLIDFMHIACAYIDDDPDRAYRYFCGICWNRIRGNDHG